MYLTTFGGLITLLAIIAGLIGYFVVKARAEEEARKVVDDWLEKEGKERAKKLLADFQEELTNAKNDAITMSEQLRIEIQKIQREVIKLTPDTVKESVSKVISTESVTLQNFVEKLRLKPEIEYAFADWNARAFDAFQQRNFALAAEYWLNSLKTTITAPSDYANSVFNIALSLSEDGKLERAIAHYNDLLTNYGQSIEPSIRELIAKALFNKGYTLGQLGRKEEEVAVYDDLLARFGQATEPSIQELVKLTLNKKNSQ